MLIFSRLLGDVSHLVAILILLLKVKHSKNKMEK